jgi:hypothetical protein
MPDLSRDGKLDEGGITILPELHYIELSPVQALNLSTTLKDWANKLTKIKADIEKELKP